jgi:hypothetical protein
VGAHEYTVERNPPSKMVATDGDRILGDQNPDLLRVRVRKGMRRSKQQEVLIHELLHCCSYPAYQNGDDEGFVDAIAPQLLQVLQENPDLVAFLTVK